MAKPSKAIRSDIVRAFESVEQDVPVLFFLLAANVIVNALTLCAIAGMLP